MKLWMKHWDELFGGMLRQTLSFCFFRDTWVVETNSYPTASLPDATTLQTATFLSVRVHFRRCRSGGWHGTVQASPEAQVWPPAEGWKSNCFKEHGKRQTQKKKKKSGQVKAWYMSRSVDKLCGEERSGGAGRNSTDHEPRRPIAAWFVPEIV